MLANVLLDLIEFAIPERLSLPGSLTPTPVHYPLGELERCCGRRNLMGKRC